MPRKRATYSWEHGDWKTLHRALAHPLNRYRYGALLPSKPRALAHRRVEGVRILRVPEGWLVLSREATAGPYALEDLSRRPIRTGPFLLTWGRAPWSPQPRAHFTVSPAWVREKARYVAFVTQGLAWPEGKPKSPPQVIAGVNAVTREVRRAQLYAFLPPETARRWEKTVRRNAWRWLTSTAGLSRREAEGWMARILGVRG